MPQADESIREPAEVDNWEGYKINKQDGTIAIVTTWDDDAEFKDMHKAFLLLGFSEAQRNELYTLLSFSMICGNIDFEENDKMEAKVKGTEEIEKAARLIQVRRGEARDPTAVTASLSWVVGRRCRGWRGGTRLRRRCRAVAVRAGPGPTWKLASTRSELAPCRHVTVCT